MKNIMNLCSASDGASKRTKNRIKEHSGQFLILDKKTVACFNNQEAILTECLCGTHKEPWRGWLPVKEIDIITCT